MKSKLKELYVLATIIIAIAVGMMVFGAWEALCFNYVAAVLLIFGGVIIGYCGCAMSDFVKLQLKRINKI